MVRTGMEAAMMFVEVLVLVWESLACVDRSSSGGEKKGN